MIGLDCIRCGKRGVLCGEHQAPGIPPARLRASAILALIGEGWGLALDAEGKSSKQRYEPQVACPDCATAVEVEHADRWRGVLQDYVDGGA